MRGFERCGNHLALYLFERAQTRNRACCSGGCRASRLRKILPLENIGFGRRRPAANSGKHEGMFECVSQLANVSRPRIGRQHSSCSLAQLRVRASVSRTMGP